MKLDTDFAIFVKAFNQRVQYFKQLQEISDTVADIEMPKPIDEMLQDLRVEETEFDTKVTANRARQRYLDHLSKVRDADPEERDEDEECCILCRCEFIRGFITAW